MLVQHRHQPFHIGPVDEHTSETQLSKGIAMRKQCIFLAILFISGCSSITDNGGWHPIMQSAEMLQIKDTEGYGMDYDFNGKIVGVADSVINAFNVIGPSQRRETINRLLGPSVHLKGATQTSLTHEINEKIRISINATGEPSMIDGNLFDTIKATYPLMTDIAVTIYYIDEEWRISGDASGRPYRWSSNVIAKTLVIDLNTKQTISEWRQEVQDRSTGQRAPESPERLINYLKPIETIQKTMGEKTR
ncbi:MAG: hypothetical protein HGA87_04785 [Desulfobulbaceae bacterium]|nr:hypothetical protein [Desulfobulbaceae bacterium]